MWNRRNTGAFRPSVVGRPPFQDRIFKGSDSGWLSKTPLNHQFGLVEQRWQTDGTKTRSGAIFLAALRKKTLCRQLFRKQVAQNDSPSSLIEWLLNDGRLSFSVSHQPTPLSPQGKVFGENNKSRPVSSSHSPNSLFTVCSDSLLSIHGLNQVYTATVLIVDLLTDAPVVPKTRQFALCSRKCYFFLHLHPNGSH